MSIMVRFILLMVTLICKSSEFLNHSELLTLADSNPDLYSESISNKGTGELFNVKCFFVKKFDVYTFEKLQNKTE